MLKASDSKKKYFDIEFSDRYNIISGNSATGKTYLRKLLAPYCVAHGIPFLQIDYTVDKRVIRGMLNSIKDDKKAVIYVDNGDILLDRETELAIVNTEAETKIFVIHSMYNISILQFFNPGIYKLYTNENGTFVSSKRLGEL